jgi:hypothetical protein
MIGQNHFKICFFASEIVFMEHFWRRDILKSLPTGLVYGWSPDPVSEMTIEFWIFFLCLIAVWKYRIRFSYLNSTVASCKFFSIFRVGDIVKDVKRMSGGWWEGTLKGKRGLFPDNFVKVRPTNLLSFCL